MFCFAIRDECKGQECMAWKNEECTLIKFLEKSIKDLEDKLPLEEVPEEIKVATTEDLLMELIEFTRSKSYDNIADVIEEFWFSKGIISRSFLPIDIRQKIQNIDINAKDILKRELEEKTVPEYVRIYTAEEMASELSEFVRNKGYYDIGYSNDFWNSKGISSTWSLPIDIKQKIDNAKNLAKEVLTKERKDRFEKEKAEIADLADACVEWTRGQGINKVVTKQIVESFLEEKSVDLLHETKYMLYNLANTKSKIKSGSGNYR